MGSGAWSLALTPWECQLTPTIAHRWHSRQASAKTGGWPLRRLVLGAADAVHAVADRVARLHDLREAHDGHDVVEVDRTVVDLLQEAHQLFDAPELRVVVLYVARGQVPHPLHFDRVDDCLEDPLAGRVLVADRHE